jgi:hypothetical protein
LIDPGAGVASSALVAMPSLGIAATLERPCESGQHDPDHRVGGSRVWVGSHASSPGDIVEDFSWFRLRNKPVCADPSPRFLSVDSTAGTMLQWRLSAVALRGGICRRTFLG